VEVSVKVKALDHIAVTVSDTERALAFYVGQLGFVQVEQHQLPESSISPVFGLTGASGQSTRLIAPDSPGVLIDLMEIYEPQPTTAIPQLGSVGACHMALTVADLAASVAELKAAGVDFISEPVTFALTEGSVTVCFMRDPDGNFIEIMEETH
jgi:catechol 2,3-dioxygenase-like lactoylglutathione lyase family enzyme